MASAACDDDLGGGPGGGGVGSFASLVSSLAEVASLVDAGPGELSRAERAAVSVVLVGAIDRLEAAASHLVGSGSDAGDHLYDGARSMGRWLTARTEAHAGRVGALLGLHHDLAPFEEIAQAWRAGVIGTAMVRAMLKAARDLQAQMVRDQARLVGLVAPLTVARADAVLGRWRAEALQELDSSPEDPRPTDQLVNSLRFRPGVGSETHAEAILDAVVNAEFQSLIDGEIDRGFRTGRYQADDGMTVEERRLDALLALMRRGTLVLSEGGESKKAVIITVDARLLHPDLGTRFGAGGDEGGGASAVERAGWPCSLIDGTPLTRDQVLDVLADQPSVTATLGFYGLNGRFHPIGETTTARLANASQRRILKIRDHGCMFPGCHQPATRCQPHHEPPYETTGRTTTDELVLLCRHHHRLRHEHDFTIDLQPDGTLTTTRPDHTPLPTTPPGHKLPTPPTRPDPRARPYPPTRPDPRAGPTVDRLRPGGSSTRAPTTRSAHGPDGPEPPPSSDPDHGRPC